MKHAYKCSLNYRHTTPTINATMSNYYIFLQYLYICDPMVIFMRKRQQFLSVFQRSLALISGKVIILMAR